MATYKQIQAETKRQFGFVPKTCWIADVKEGLGLTSRQAANRIDPRRIKYSCPAAKRSSLIKIISTL